MSQEEQNILFLSLRVACFATALGLPWALLFGWLFARRSFWGRSFLETTLTLPLVLPPIVTGYVLLSLLGRNSWLGRSLHTLQIDIPFTQYAAILAASIVSFPLLLRAVQIAIEHVDPKLEEAARTLGATSFQIFFQITLPLAWKGIIAGMLLAFTRSLGEFGATIIFAGNIPGQTQTLPLAIYSLDQAGTTQSEWMAQKLVWWMILLSLFATGLSRLLQRPTHHKPLKNKEHLENQKLTTTPKESFFVAPKASSDLRPREHFLQVECTYRHTAFSLRTKWETKAGITALCGPSGSGKTTTLHCIAGLYTPQSGHIQHNDLVFLDTHNTIDIPPEQRRIGMVFQEDRLFPHLTVQKNLLFGYKKCPIQSRTIHPQELIKQLHLESLLHRKPNTLSGGERQRVALARAFLMSPQLLLLDEPFNSLDPVRKKHLLQHVTHLHQRYGIPIVFVSHDERDIEQLAEFRIDITTVSSNMLEEKVG